MNVPPAKEWQSSGVTFRTAGGAAPTINDFIQRHNLNGYICAYASVPEKPHFYVLFRNGKAVFSDPIFDMMFNTVAALAEQVEIPEEPPSPYSTFLSTSKPYCPFCKTERPEPEEFISSGILLICSDCGGDYQLEATYETIRYTTRPVNPPPSLEDQQDECPPDGSTVS